MNYSNDYHITSLEEVEFFFYHLVYELDLNFHPDDPFEDLVGSDDSFFTQERIDKYNSLMEESFCVCENEDVEIYAIGLPILRNRIEQKDYVIKLSTKALIKCILSMKGEPMTNMEIISFIKNDDVFSNLCKEEVTAEVLSSTINNEEGAFIEENGLISLNMQ